MKLNVFCLGDSITYGLNGEGGGWCDRLKNYYLELEYIGSKLPIRVWNFGISRQTVADLVDERMRFKEPVSRINFEKPTKNIFVLAFGANDAAFDLERQEFLNPKEKYYSYFEELIRYYSCHGECLILNISPVSKEVEVNKSRQI